MDDNLWGNLEPVTGAASKRPSMADAPTKQPMKAGIKPAQQKAPSGDQKKFRRSMNKKSSATVCPQCGSTDIADHSEHYQCYHCGFEFNDDGSEWTNSGLSPHPDHTGSQTCPTCGGSGWIEDPTACGDPEHCDPLQICPTCNADGSKPYPEEHMLASRHPQTSSTATSTIPTKESTMTEQTTPENTEANLLARMASATTLTEQAALAALLDSHRASRREAASAEAGLDWGAMDAPTQYDGPSAYAAQYLSTTAAAARETDLPSDRTYTEHLSNHRTSAESDWLMDVFPEEVDTTTMATAMRAQAVGWYENEVWGPVKDVASEFSVQAHNAAVRAGSAYGLSATAAASVFIDTVSHLYRKDKGLSMTAEWGTDPMRPGPDPTIDTYVSDGRDSLPVGVDPAKAETFDEDTLPGAAGASDPKSTTSTSEAPSLTEGDAPEGDSAEGAENPLTGDTSVDKSTFNVGDTSDKMKTQGSFFHHDTPSGSGPMGDQSEWDAMAAATRARKEQMAQERGEAAAQTGSTTSMFEGSMFEALRQPFAAPAPATHTADAQSSEWGLGEGIDEGDTPEGDHAESATQNNGEGASDQSGSGQGWPTNPGTGGTGDATSGAAPGTPYHSSVHLAEGMTCAVCGDSITHDPSSENPSTYHHDNGEKHDHEAKPASKVKESALANLSPNAQVFMQTLQSMASLDEVVAGISGHQIVGFLSKDPTVPETLREALRGGALPFAREAAGKEAADTCSGSGAQMVDAGERNTTDSKFFGYALGKCPVCGKSVRSKDGKTPRHAAQSKESSQHIAADRGPSYDPESTKDLPLHGSTSATHYYYNQGYDDARAGKDRWGYGSRDKTILYSHGYEHGLKDKGKKSSLKTADSDLFFGPGSKKNPDDYEAVEGTCKNCGKPIMKSADGRWYHKDSHANACASGGTGAEPKTPEKTSVLAIADAVMSRTAGEGARIPYKCPNCGKTWVKKTMYGGETCPKCGTKGEVNWPKKDAMNTTALEDTRSDHIKGREQGYLDAHVDTLDLSHPSKTEEWNKASDEWKRGWGEGYEHGHSRQRVPDQRKAAVAYVEGTAGRNLLATINANLHTMGDRRRRHPDTFSLSDAKNEDGEWIMSPEQIRAEQNAEQDAPDPDDFYNDDY